MARSKRAWSSLKPEIYRYLKETEGSSFWSEALLLDLFNMNLDSRTMQLCEAHEGWAVVPYTADIVADQARYTIPEQANSIKQLVWVDTVRQFERPMTRDERTARGQTTRSTSGVPTYRLVGNYIVLEPTPRTAVTAGLRIEIEESSPRLSASTDTLPAGYPIFMESLLTLDTSLAAIGIEEAQGTGDSKRKGQLEKLHERYQVQFEMFCENRSYGREYAQRNYMGG